VSAVRVGVLTAKVRAGDAGARDAPYESCFARLRLIAASLQSRERREHTLQPTALMPSCFSNCAGLNVLFWTKITSSVWR